jgi:hypothetical protein
LFLLLFEDLLRDSLLVFVRHRQVGQVWTVSRRKDINKSFDLEQAATSYGLETPLSRLRTSQQTYPVAMSVFPGLLHWRRIHSPRTLLQPASPAPSLQLRGSSSMGEAGTRDPDWRRIHELAGGTTSPFPLGSPWGFGYSPVSFPFPLAYLATPRRRFSSTG